MEKINVRKIEGDKKREKKKRIKENKVEGDGGENLLYVLHD